MKRLGMLAVDALVVAFGVAVLAADAALAGAIMVRGALR